MCSTSSSPTLLSSSTLLSTTRSPHSGRWPRTARLVWRERVEVDDKGESIFVWDEVWTRPSRKFGRSKEGRLRQVAEIPSLAPHFPRLLKANRHNGVLTLARPNFSRTASLADLDVATIRRLKAELQAIYRAMYDNAIAYIFSPEGFQICTSSSAEEAPGAARTEWRIYIDGWNHASRHKLRSPGAKKTAYFAEMEAEQLQKIEDHFTPFESRAKRKTSAMITHESHGVA